MNLSSTMPLDRLTAAIFDMDGLLIDSEPVWMRVEQSVMLEVAGIDVTHAMLMQYQGRSTRAFCLGMAKAFPEAGIKVEALLERLLSRMREEIVHAPLLPGSAEILSWLASRNIPLSIASSSPLSFIQTVVDRHQLPVTQLTSGTEVAASKPHPAVFELAASRLGVATEQCLVWEDSVNGVIAGKAAGMSVIAIPDAEHPTPEKFSIADACHSSLTHSFAWLQEADLFRPSSIYQE